MTYQPRLYRTKMGCELLQYFCLTVQESDLWIGIDRGADLTLIKRVSLDYLICLRHTADQYIKENPLFKTSLIPLELDTNAPFFIQEMYQAAKLANVGPMAAVAGTFAEAMGKFLVENFHLQDVIIENGGDLWLKTTRDLLISIHAPTSVLNDCFALKIRAEQSPISICTSAGTIGHSLSFGKADAAVVVSKSGAIADAYATSFGNLVQNKSELTTLINQIELTNQLQEVVFIVEDQIAVKGNIELKLIKSPPKSAQQ